MIMASLTIGRAGIEAWLTLRAPSVAVAVQSLEPRTALSFKLELLRR